MSITTRLYGIFAHSTGQRPMMVPALFNALFDRHGIDAIFVLFQVTAEHVAAAIAGMRHLRNFAGFAVTMPHKAAVAQLCDTLLPNAQACGVVNTVRIDPDGRLIGETFDGVGMVQAITAHRTFFTPSRRHGLRPRARKTKARHVSPKVILMAKSLSGRPPR